MGSPRDAVGPPTWQPHWGLFLSWCVLAVGPTVVRAADSARTWEAGTQHPRRTDAISGLDQRTTAKVILISVVAAVVGGFLFGFDTAVINGAVDSIQGAFHLSPGLTGFAVSCALLGSAVGAW